MKQIEITTAEIDAIVEAAGQVLYMIGCRADQIAARTKVHTTTVLIEDNGFRADLAFVFGATRVLDEDRARYIASVLTVEADRRIAIRLRGVQLTD